MKALNRRTFLKMAGASSVAATGIGAGAAGAGILGSAAMARTYTFRAVAGLPAKPLPSYASYVIDGHVDLSAKSGVITRMLFAGHPEAISSIALPGTSQVVRVTRVEELGNILVIKGLVDERSQLQRGESPQFSMRIDLSSHTARATFLGSEVALNLV